MFVGRKTELEELKSRFKMGTSQLIVCMGRRRIGKSTLIEELGKSVPHFYEFQGLHPKEAPNETDQLAYFSKKLMIYFKRPKMEFSSWTEAFNEFSILLPKKGCLVFFDEISWMGSGAKTFSAELKEAWDTLFKKHPHIMLAIAGSVSSWIDENILKNSNFLGRISWQLQLGELPLSVQKEFWGSKKNRVSNFDFIRTVAFTGGVPRYLEEINPNESAEQNIQRLCFNKTGFLVYEFEKIFSDIFSKRGPLYKKIVLSLVHGPLSLSEISKKIEMIKSGVLSKYLDDLIQSGFLSENISYDFNGKKLKLSKFRLQDNYLRFALKYIEPNKERIIEGQYMMKNMDHLPGWKTIFGLQFENMILNNRWLIVERLNLVKSDIINCGPFVQHKTTKNKGGCQIDLFITTKNYQIYVCEIKCVEKISNSVITDIKNKISVLKHPKYYTVHPVLIYTGDLAPKITESKYAELICIDDLI